MTKEERVAFTKAIASSIAGLRKSVAYVHQGEYLKAAGLLSVIASALQTMAEKIK